MAHSTYRWITQLRTTDGKVAGGKGASLGELALAGVAVPKGFVILTNAYEEYVEKTRLSGLLPKFVAAYKDADMKRVYHISNRIKQVISATPLPDALVKRIVKGWYYMGNPVVAVRSSAPEEDSTSASFAGQHTTVLGVNDMESLLTAVRRCFASLYEPRAIAYRLEQGIGIKDASIAVVIQTLINPVASGVMFTRNPANGDDVVVIEAVYGLGETLVSGSITPDHYEIDSDSRVVVREVVEQSEVLMYSVGKVRMLNKAFTKPKLSKAQMLKLADIGRKLEAHYGEPLDIEWTVDDGMGFQILQARPITTRDAQKANTLIDAPILASGNPASFGVITGNVRRIVDVSDLDKVQDGDILVTSMTTPDWVPAFKKIAGLVTELGGMTCHAAIVAREYGLPCIVGAKNALTVTDGVAATLDGSNGVLYFGDVTSQII